MRSDGILFHPNDPTSYLILSSHLLAENHRAIPTFPSHVYHLFFFFPTRPKLLFISGCSGFNSSLSCSLQKCAVFESIVI